MQSYKDKIYVFGGMLKIKKMKSLTNEINIFNTSKIYLIKKFKEINKIIH